MYVRVQACVSVQINQTSAQLTRTNTHARITTTTMTTGLHAVGLGGLGGGAGGWLVYAQICAHDFGDV